MVGDNEGLLRGYILVDGKKQQIALTIEDGKIIILVPKGFEVNIKDITEFRFS